jgi:hypothetical protein
MGDVDSDKKSWRSLPLELLKVEVGLLSAMVSCSNRVDCSASAECIPLPVSTIRDPRSLLLRRLCDDFGSASDMRTSSMAPTTVRNREKRSNEEQSGMLYKGTRRHSAERTKTIKRKTIKHTPWSFMMTRKREATHTQTASRGRTGIVTTMVSVRAAALVVAIVARGLLLLLLLMDLVGMLMMTTGMPLISVRMVRNIRIFVAVKQVDTSTAIPCSPRGLCQVGHAVAVGVMLMLVTQTTTPGVTAFH